MLPPGHVAAGYLTTQAILAIFKPAISTAEFNSLIWWGMFFSFAPDLDSFLAFAKVKSFYFYKKDNSIHRYFFTHIPILWLIAGLTIYFIAVAPYWKMFGLIVWLASWSHLLLDSVEFGVMWLWPFNIELWALKNRGIKKQIDEPGFFGYWFGFLKSYTRRATFYLEIIILIFALIVYFK